MRKTCFNCKQFSRTMCDPEGDYHIHYFCRMWQTVFANHFASEDRYEYKNGLVFDDLETGKAYCYMFEAREKPMYEDAWFEKNEQSNIANRASDEL